MNKWLTKIDRFAAWVLFASMLLYFVTGYGMTKGIISTPLSVKIHLGITPVIISSFVLHTSLAIRLAFMRWKIWGKGTLVLLILFYLSFFSFFIYLDQFYGKEEDDDNSDGISQSISSSPSQGPSNSASPKSQEKIFSINELAQYNGKNGMPAYVAVDGVVYDLSSVFTSGSHFSHFAGEELTNAFYAVHAKSAIAKYPVVGRLE